MNNCIDRHKNCDIEDIKNSLREKYNISKDYFESIIDRLYEASYCQVCNNCKGSGVVPCEQSLENICESCEGKGIAKI
jgi:DnaJ-class molecular chaperone